MSESPSLDALIHLINHLMENDGYDLDRAIKKANVTPNNIGLIRAYFEESVEIGPASVLEAPDSKTIFCQMGESGNTEPFYTSFRAFLRNQRRWGKSSVESLDRNALLLIQKLPDPRKMNQFASRGLVLGHIQSGKTATMAALISKAADRGYKFIIILSGLYNDLRAQTQKRIDQEFTAQSDLESDYPVVKHPPLTPKVTRLTHSGLQGDFRSPPFSEFREDVVKVAVIKKNVRVLSKFLEWLEEHHESIEGLPALIIDDEADQATPNSNYGKLDDEGEEIDPSATNQKLRGLVRQFRKCAYVGFTATPFANLLTDKEIPEDLYPRDFIVSLPEPPNYLGPRQLFGLGLSPSELSTEVNQPPALDAIREISDADMTLLGQIRPDSEIPDILERAVLSYLLASCARVERGQENQHFSMFIHPSYKTVVQETMKELIGNYVERHLKQYVLGGERHAKDFHRRARKLWNEDFVRVSEALGISSPSFDKIWKHALLIVNSIEVRSLNSRSLDTTDFTPQHPRRYIVIGGNRLSRGLTIEGLSTSVFLRDSPYYDTLLQMGRWFGYRPGYEDLTRIFVEESIADNFASLARVEHELREDLKKYSLSSPPLTPLQLSPIIRDCHSMFVTQRNKMGAGRIVTPWFSGKLKQTVTFPTDDIEKIRKNIEASRTFIKKLGPPKLKNSNLIGWADVPCNEIMAFINEYNFGDALEINAAVLLTYLQKMNKLNELRKWDVTIPSGSTKTFDWGNGIESKTIRRSPVTRKSIGVLSSASDLKAWEVGFRRDRKDPDRGALILYAIDGDQTNASQLSFYAAEEKLDIVGLVMVFPNSGKLIPANYISQDFQ